MSKGRSVSKQCMSKEQQTTPEDVEMVTIPKHVLQLLLEGPKLVSEAVIHAKTVANKIILTQRDELQRLVDAWSPGNSEALFTACLEMILELLLKGPQLVSEAVIHAKTVANKIILT